MTEDFFGAMRANRRSRVEIENDKKRQGLRPRMKETRLTAQDAQDRAYAAILRDGSEDFTGYPRLPVSAQTDGRHPAKKSDSDAAATAAASAAAAAATAAAAAAAANTNANARVSRGGDTMTGGLTVQGLLTPSGGLPSSIIGSTHLITGSVLHAHMDAENLNPAQIVSGMRSIVGNAASVQASPSNHFHSISFKALPKEERLRLMDIDDALKEGQGSLPLLKDMVRAIFSMLADDPTMGRREREAKIETDPAFAHEVRMLNDQEYYARTMLLTDERFRKLQPQHSHVEQVARDMEELVELPDGTFALKEGEDTNTLPEGETLDFERTAEDFSPREARDLLRGGKALYCNTGSALWKARLIDDEEWREAYLLLGTVGGVQHFAMAAPSYPELLNLMAQQAPLGAWGLPTATQPEEEEA